MRVLGTVLCAVLCSGPAIAAPPDPGPEPPGYDEARAALASGDYETAAQWYRAQLEASPGWSAGHVTLGQCEFLLGRPAEAVRHIEAAHELDPDLDLFAVYDPPARVLYKDGRFAEAVRPFELALRHAPESTRRSAAVLLAHVYLQARQYEQARRTFLEVREHHGLDPEDDYYLALACRQAGDLDGAVGALERVKDTEVAQRPDRKVLEYLARWSHARALAPENRSRRDALLASAGDHTRAWLEADPAADGAIEVHAKTRLAAGRARELVSELAPLASRDSPPCAALRYLAEAWTVVGDHGAAESRAREAVRCDPQSGPTYAALASALVGQLRSEHTGLEDVLADQSRAREAVEALERAARLGAAGAEPLREQLHATLAQLEAAQVAFADRDRAYDDKVAEARRAEIRQRCLGILWAMRDESRPLPAEDLAFHREHECKQYAHEGSVRASSGSAR